jgi:demethylmenaquinone methyltransferase/2-methoxy-6-polyprenyl-1,4-benzoquinol methylase
MSLFVPACCQGLPQRPEDDGRGLPSHADKAAVVEAMFDRIAPRYDLLNRLLTLRLDQRWRRALIRQTGIGPRDVVVDLGCGTGDLCTLAARAGARVIGVDFAAGMLAAARRRGVHTPLVRADAAWLPLSPASASVVTSAFALRNFVSIAPVLAEAARILRPGGRLALLEVDRPVGAVARWGHELYFRRIVPLIGAVLSDAAAYAYLPRSTAYLPPAPQLLELIAAAGFCDIVRRPLSAGVAQLIVARRRRGFAQNVPSKRARFETAPEETGPPQRKREETCGKQEITARPEEPPPEQARSFRAVSKGSGGVSKGARWELVRTARGR